MNPIQETSPSVVAVCIGAEKGIPRPSVPEGTLCEGVGFVGNLHSVGGNREVCLYEMETYEALRAEGIPVGPGSFGENLVIAGIPFGDLQGGSRLALGEAEIEITIPRTGCANLTQLDLRLPDAIAGRAGWMARVVRGGVVRPGDPVRMTVG